MYEDVTRPGARMPNRLTDVGPKEFGRSLEANGWSRVDKDWGTVYEKEGRDISCVVMQRLTMDGRPSSSTPDPERLISRSGWGATNVGD